jgi:hypothetical protein
MIQKSENYQAPEKKIVRVFLRHMKEATFTCPKCNYLVVKDLSKLVPFQSAIRINCKCKCGHSFRTLVERRQYFRQSVNLVGMCFYRDGEGNLKEELIKIIDISKSGLQISINRESVFKMGDRLTVEFRLDDIERSAIREEGTVKRIRSKNVGMQFDTIDLYGKLANYLFR